MSSPRSAGDLSTWLVDMGRALAGDQASEVPCDGCTACCRASQFIHIGPDESATLARVPAELAFPAPGWPEGHVVMGYDEHGHCPMLVDDRCSIYDDRPRACRTYDCRVFAATGVEPDTPGQEPVAEQVRRWRFDPGMAEDAARLDALAAAASYLAEHPEAFGPDAAPVGATRRAVLAVELHERFLDGEPSPEWVRVEISRRARAQR